ncbi:MAG: hypothetical protein AB7K71_14600 [Polyangiaceae bacterium]
MGIWKSWALALGLLFSSAPALASPTVTWSAPRECGDAAAFNQAVARELGARTLPGSVRIEVRPRGEAYAMQLEMRVAGDGGELLLERQLLAPTCLELRSAAISVLLVSATEARSELPVEVVGPPTAQPPTAQPPASPASSRLAVPLPHPQNPVEPEDHRDFWHFEWHLQPPMIGASAGLESGRVGEAVPRLQGHLRLPLIDSSVGILGIAAAGLYVPAERHAVDPERGGELSRAAGRLGGMLLVERGIEPFSLQLAFQGELSRVSGTGYGVTSPTTRGVWRTALVSEGELGVAFERLALGLWGELAVARDDSRYVLEGVGEVYRPSILAVGGGLRAWLRFP